MNTPSNLMIKTSIVDQLVNWPMLRLCDTVSNRVGKARGQARRFDVVLYACVLVRIQGNVRLLGHSWIALVSQLFQLTYCGVERVLVKSEFNLEHLLK